MVSVLVPVRNEERCIGVCLESILAQDYPPEKIEILVMDGNSTDATVSIVRNFAKMTGRVRCIDNPGQLASAALNIGILESAGSILIRMDAHGKAPSNYVSCVVKHLLGRNVDHVGVKQRAVGTSFWGRSIAFGMTNSFGVGGSKHRCALNDGSEEAGWSGGFIKSRLVRMGGFDETVGPNDDDDFFFRLQKSGGTLYRTAEVEIDYYCRTSLWLLWNQFYRYGYFKPHVICKNRHAYPRHFVPPFFVAALLMLTLLSTWNSLAAGALAILGGLYGGVSLMLAARAVQHVGVSVAASLPITFAVLHVSYGSGFLLGLVRLIVRGLPQPCQLIRAPVQSTIEGGP
jgi:succinoglycan biosynthesis protein ExoA